MTAEEGFRNTWQREFGMNTCFLCRCELTRQNRTDEHVIPKWVQRRFDLWNETLEMLNGTTIPYRQLIIPCCLNSGDSIRNFHSQAAAAWPPSDRDCRRQGLQTPRGSQTPRDCRHP